jgi:hypothetical protein
MTVEIAIKEFEKTYQKKSYTGNTTTNGYLTNTYADEVNIKAVIQPMSPKELRNVPEGQNTLDWISAWVRNSINLKDIIIYNGNEYEVQKKEYWNETPYNKVSAVITKDEGF